jgi:type IV pilus assembly protein PilW
MKKNASVAAQQGVTLVELLVALTVGLVVTILALGMLVLGRGGYDAVDSSTQLVDRERFAVDVLSRVISQAGYQDYGAFPLITRAIEKKRLPLVEPEPDLFGWNNAFYTQIDDLAITDSTKIVDGNRPSKCGSFTDTSCQNGSDVLAVRFHGVDTVDPAGLLIPDGTMVNCMGQSEPGPRAAGLDGRAVSLMYVHRDGNTGEPSLYCSYYNHATGAWVAGQALIEGVESMQVLFGTDNVVPLTIPTAGGQDFIVDRWLRADQLKVAGNSVATKENWRRVRAVRVGLVLRGPPGSAQERVAASFAPLGTQTYVASADAGSQLNVAADGRLRRVVNFTVHIRNDLSTR